MQLEKVVKLRPELLCPKTLILFCRTRPSLQLTLPETTQNVTDNVIKALIISRLITVTIASQWLWLYFVFLCYQSLQWKLSCCLISIDIIDHIKKVPPVCFPAEFFHVQLNWLTGSSVDSFCFFATYARNSGKSIEPLSLESSLKKYRNASLIGQT